MKYIGIDEVGRGAWAGPLVVAAVRFTGKVPAGLKDSKKLSKDRREDLALEINQSSQSAIMFSDCREIDLLGLTACLRKAALRLASIIGHNNDEIIIIDGNYNFLIGTPFERATKTVVKADNLYPEVMAASILAKVARDSYMAYLHTLKPYKDYAFDSHVGYGTALHQAALKEFGVSLVHRLSFKPVRLVAENYYGND